MQATRKCSRLSACRGAIVGYKCSRLSALGRCIILILLNVLWSAEARQCYWCGPLSEQVHRSRRVLPCRGQLSSAACDPGYDHCAVIASAPNYVESRLCVKLYQDECYPTFCNSSKAWRMTCPCRGDLCNGPNTERETEAFVVLEKLAAKTQLRIKKRSSKLDTDELMLNMGNNDINERKNNNNDDIDSKQEKVPTIYKQDTSKSEKIPNVTSFEEYENIVTETTTINVKVNKNELKLDEMQSDQPKPGHDDDGAAKLKVNQMATNNLENDMENNKEPKSDKNSNGTNVKVNSEQAATVKVETDKLMEPPTGVKTTSKMSTTQAVQVSTEATKPTQSTPTSCETNTTKEQTTGPTTPNKNSAVGVYLHAILLVKWLIIYYCS